MTDKKEASYNLTSGWSEGGGQKSSDCKPWSHVHTYEVRKDICACIWGLWRHNRTLMRWVKTYICRLRSPWSFCSRSLTCVMASFSLHACRGVCVCVCACVRACVNKCGCCFESRHYFSAQSERDTMQYNLKRTVRLNLKEPYDFQKSRTNAKISIRERLHPPSISPLHLWLGDLNFYFFCLHFTVSHLFDFICVLVE